MIVMRNKVIFLVRAIAVVIISAGIYFLTRPTCILLDFLKGNLSVNDIPWEFFLILSAFSILLLVTGAGLFLLKRWARKLAIPLLTIYSIGSVISALFICIPLFPGQINAITLTLPPPVLWLVLSPDFIRTVASIMGLNATVSLAFRMILRDNHVIELFKMDAILRRSKKDA